jgi:2-polyprenyl-3-methyl-5-hydroxy-6-metoxy-1,4-benzoquinol methylase
MISLSPVNVAGLRSMISKTDQVRSLFEIPEKYLDPRQYDIRIRVETVRQFTDSLKFDHILDIGCGDGSISLPLLPRCNKVTLLDLSRNMLALASRRIPSDRLNDVELIGGDFMGANLEPQSFDLIFCVGVLAHVDSPAAVIEKVAQLAKPGAWVILEFTDSFHFWGVPVVLYQKILKLLRPEPYKLNRLKRRQVLGLCGENGLRVSGVYRYGLPPLGSHKFLSQEGMYSLTRHLFGPSDQNRKGWMGNQFIYRFQKTSLSLQPPEVEHSWS